MEYIMNFSQLGKFQELKKHLDLFRSNHPKFPLFLGAVTREALEEGTLLEMSVTTPEGKHFETNLKLKSGDLEFIRAIQSMTKQ